MRPGQARLAVWLVGDQQEVGRASTVSAVPVAGRPAAARSETRAIARWVSAKVARRSGVALQGVPLLELGVGVFHDDAAAGWAASGFALGSFAALAGAVVPGYEHL